MPTTAPSPANRRYHCISGEIEVACANAVQWHALAVCIGRPELSYNGAWDVVRHAASDGPIARVLEEMFGEDDAASWKLRLDTHDVPCRVV